MNYGEFLETIYDLLDLGERGPMTPLEEIIAALKAKLARPAVDREELAKLLHRRGNSDVLWEDVSEAMRDHFRDMAGGFLASIGVSATGVNLEAANRELQVRLELQQDLINVYKSREALLAQQLEAREVELAKMRQDIKAFLDAAKSFHAEADRSKTREQMRLDLARQGDELSAALDAANNEIARLTAALDAKGVLFEQAKMERDAAQAALASERKKWPELKAEVERLRGEADRLREANRELARAAIKRPLDRDRIRLALLDCKPDVAQLSQSVVNDLADHLVKRLG